jgi:hypothetical protein
VTFRPAYLPPLLTSHTKEQIQFIHASVTAPYAAIRIDLTEFYLIHSWNAVRVPQLLRWASYPYSQLTQTTNSIVPLMITRLMLSFRRATRSPDFVWRFSDSFQYWPLCRCAFEVDCRSLYFTTAIIHLVSPSTPCIRRPLRSCYPSTLD